jgi:hypothetical protein
MLERLSGEALRSLAEALSAERAFEATAAMRATYSPALHRWLLDAAAREQGIRRGETHGPLCMPNLSPAELTRAQMFAAALAMAFENIVLGFPVGTSEATRARYLALAREIQPAMLTLAEALGVLAGAPAETVH